MRWTYAVAVLLLPAIVGTSSCAQSQSKQKKEVQVKVVREGGTWLGVTLRDMTADLAKEKGVKTESGALVTSVTEDSPAEKAGIQEDDIIVGFGGDKIGDSDDLVKAVHEKKKGETVDVVVVRGENKKTLQATLAESSGRPETYSFTVPTPPAMPHALSWFGGGGMYGLRLSTLSRQLGEYFGAPNGHGVLVTEVTKKSPAATAGFKAGDVIVKIGSETIEDIHDIRSALEDYKKGDKASVEVLRKGSRTSLSLEVTGSPDHWKSGNFFWYGDHPEGIHDEESGEDAPALIEQNAFHRDMELLEKNLQEMGKKLKEDMKVLKQRLQHDLQRLYGV